jgi:hypothetical protein
MSLRRATQLGVMRTHRSPPVAVFFRLKMPTSLYEATSANIASHPVARHDVLTHSRRRPCGAGRLCSTNDRYQRLL